MEIASKLPNAYLKVNLNQKFPLLLWGSKICQHKPHIPAFQKLRNVGRRKHLMKRPDELLPGIRLEIIQHHLSDEQPGLTCPRWPTLPIVNLSTHCWPSSSSAPVNQKPRINSPQEYEFRIAVSYPSVKAWRAAFPSCWRASCISEIRATAGASRKQVVRGKPNKEPPVDVHNIHPFFIILWGWMALRQSLLRRRHPPFLIR